jgi:arylsulfatase A-like enzyme
MVHDHQPDGKYPDSKRHPLPAFSSTAFADAAIRFIEEQAIIEEQVSDGRNNPFFACVFFTAPHDPRTPPTKFLSMYPAEKMPLPANFLPEHPFDNGELNSRDEKLPPFARTPEVVKEHLAAYYAMISQLDAQVGRLIDALQENGLSENTLVIFTSDHGLAVGSHGLLGKQNLYEHSTRVPMVVAGPGVTAGRVSNQPIYLHDLVATISEVAGIDAPAHSEGISFLESIRGNKQPPRQEIYTAYKGVQRALRAGKWKLIRYPVIDRVQLFNLDTDPDETLDLSQDPRFQKRLKEMLGRLDHRRQLQEDPLVDDGDSH